MRLSFRSFALIVTVVYFGLALVWLAAPQLLLNMWDVQSSEAVGLVGRRCAALYLGISVMFFVARDAGPSVARRGLLAGLGICCAALAALGVFEFAAGRAGAGIFGAVVTELLLAGASFVLLSAKPERVPELQAEQR